MADDDTNSSAVHPQSASTDCNDSGSAILSTPTPTTQTFETVEDLPPAVTSSANGDILTLANQPQYGGSNDSLVSSTDTVCGDESISPTPPPTPPSANSTVTAAAAALLDSNRDEVANPTAPALPPRTKTSPPASIHNQNHAAQTNNQNNNPINNINNNHNNNNNIITATNNPTDTESTNDKQPPSLDVDDPLQSNKLVTLFDQPVFIRPNGQTKLVSASGGRKSAASVMMMGGMAPPAAVAKATVTTEAPKQAMQHPPPLPMPPTPAQPPQRVLISSTTTSTINTVQSAPVVVAVGGGGGGATLASHMATNNNATNSPPSQQQQHQQQQAQTPQSKPGQARVIMFCQPSSHPFQTRTIVLEPNVDVKVGRSITRNRVCDSNAIFDCKVLSRNHAQIWMSENNKFYIRDTASSNGTFVNDHRLSLTATTSMPFEVKTGDVVQFGVDVLENVFKEKHGCIVTMLKFCTGNNDDDDLVDPSTIGRSHHLNGSVNGGGGQNNGGGGGAGGTHHLSSVELYKLNEFIQEAMQRELLLESKLASLQKIVELTRKNSANVWHSMIEEDHLLGRIDILENKLQYFQNNVTDDKLRMELLKLQDDKSVYQSSAKEALRKVYQERNEAVMKLTTIERALCSSEDECSLLRNQLAKMQQGFKEVSVQLVQLEERSVDEQEHQRQLAEVHRQRDHQVTDLCEQLRDKADEAGELEKQLRGMQAQCEDLHARIETYAKMGERRELRRRRRQEKRPMQRDSDGDVDETRKSVDGRRIDGHDHDGEDDDDEDDDDDEVVEHGGDDDDDEDDEDDDDDEDKELAGGKSGSSTVNKWLDRLSAEAAKAKRSPTKVKKSQAQTANKQLADRLDGIDENLRALDKLLSTLKHNRDSSDSDSSPPSKKVQNTNDIRTTTTNSANDSITSVDSDGNETELLYSIADRMRHVYAEMLLNVEQCGSQAAHEMDVVQEQLQQYQQQNAELHAQEQQTAQRLLAIEQQCQLDARARLELLVRCDALEQRLAEADAVQSLAAALDDDDDDDDDVASADVNDSEVTEIVSNVRSNVDTTTTAVQTEFSTVESTIENSTTAAELLNSIDVTPVTTITWNGTASNNSSSAAASFVTAAGGDFRLSEYADDIVLLSDPVVRHEEELIAFKEECARLRAHAQLVEQQLADTQKRLNVGTKQPLMIYAALAMAVIGYICVSPYW